MYTSTDFPELSLFIKDTVDCFEKWNILLHYSHQPQTTETVCSLTKLTGKPEEAIKKAVDDLLMQGVLYHNENSKDDIYLSSEKAPIFEKLKSGLTDKSTRLRLLMVAVESIRVKTNTSKGGNR
jgi:hypothetical protein